MYIYRFSFGGEYIYIYIKCFFDLDYNIHILC
jgi:hypothetical protein